MFFFFKQKTAYEVRISDWSSDVCSSDLEARDGEREERERRRDADQLVDATEKLAFVPSDTDVHGAVDDMLVGKAAARDVRAGYGIIADLAHQRPVLRLRRQRPCLAVRRTQEIGRAGRLDRSEERRGGEE